MCVPTIISADDLMKFYTYVAHHTDLNLENDSVLMFQPYGWQLHSPPRRTLLQSPGMLPYSPLSVSYNGKTCILFRARKLAIRYRNHSLVDLTESTFSTDAPVDTKGSFCSKDKATWVQLLSNVDSSPVYHKYRSRLHSTPKYNVKTTTIIYDYNRIHYILFCVMSWWIFVFWSEMFSRRIPYDLKTTSAWCKMYNWYGKCDT